LNRVQRRDFLIAAGALLAAPLAADAKQAEGLRVFAWPPAMFGDAP